MIDAYVSKESIRSDSLFSQIFQKKKSENTSRLYARTMPIAEWTQYDFQLQGDAIYLTGTCFQDEGKGNDRFPQISHIQPQLLSADYLPAKTYIFFQLGIKDIHGIVSTLAYNDSVVRKELYKDMPCDGEFYQFLEDYAKNEIDIVEFLGKDIIYYRMLVSVIGVGGLLREVRGVITEYLGQTERIRNAEDKVTASCKLDFIIAGIAVFYYDVVTGASPISLEAAPSFLSGIIKTIS